MSQRVLVLVKIFHAEADLGSLVEQARARFSGDWDAHQQDIRRFWDSVREEIAKLGLDYSRLKVYHDSLALEGEPGRKMVDEMASKGSPGFALVREMLERGAVLVRTEDMALLLREYALLSLGVPDREKHAQELLLLRDRYIAQRISQTLGKGETGVLFLGAFHNITPFLPRDIHLVEVSGKVPPSRSQGRTCTRGGTSTPCRTPGTEKQACARTSGTNGGLPKR